MTRKLCVGFTGHRDCASSDWLREGLYDAVTRAATNGARWFMSGGAPGWDLEFLRAAMIERWEVAGKPGDFDGMFDVKGLPGGLVVMAVLPYKGFWEYYKEKSPTLRQELETIEPQLDVVQRLFDGPYDVGKIYARNRYIVDQNDAIVAVFDSRKEGSTYYTLQYARKRRKPIYLLEANKKIARWIRPGVDYG